MTTLIKTAVATLFTDLFFTLPMTASAADPKPVNALHPSRHPLLRMRGLRKAVGLLCLLTFAGCSDDNGNSLFTPVEEEEPAIILVKGAPMSAANGLFFDADDMLYVANGFGQTISKLDPETGEVLERLGNAEGVNSPDDLTFSADGTLYWTNTFVGQVMGRPPGGPSFEVTNDLPWVNPITIGDDGRLYVAQCFNTEPNGIFELDPQGITEPRTIRDGDADCASNGMDWWDGVLYSPRWFEGRVVQVDVDSGELTDVTTGWTGSPAAVKFNSLGELHAANQSNGEVVRIDLATGEREVLAEFPPGWLDNLAFDSDDRLYVSSSSDGAVVELLPDGEQREVSPGGMTPPLGIALIGDTVYTASLQGFRGFDSRSGELRSVVRTVGGAQGGIFSISAVGEQLILIGLGSDRLAIWDLTSNTAVLDTFSSFLFPVDAEPFGDDLLVTELTGRVIRAKLPDLEQRETVSTGGAMGLAVHEDNAWVSNAGMGTVSQFIRDGEVLAAPELVVDELAMPEGMAITPDGTGLLIVLGGSSTLIEVSLETGEQTTIATDLEFQPQVFPTLPSHWFNDVDVDAEGNMFVNSDGGNIIYRFPPGTRVE